MVNHIHSIRTAAALLVAAFSVCLIAATPVSAQAGSEKAGAAAQQTNDESRKKIRKANDLKLKAQEPLFPEQAKSLAKGYKETAEIVARQGGNPKPILDAAAYFESQPELVSRVKPNK